MICRNLNMWNRATQSNNEDEIWPQFIYNHEVELKHQHLTVLSNMQLHQSIITRLNSRVSFKPTGETIMYINTRLLSSLILASHPWENGMNGHTASRWA